MRGATMVDFGRVITAMVTPFDDNFNIDYLQVRKLVNHLAENGSDGIVVVGTTGESPTLTKEEKIKLYKTVKDEAGNKVKIIAGTGSNNTQETANLSKIAADIGVDGIMLVVPYYNKPSQEGIYRHFSTVAKQVDLPIMLYNVPGRTVTNMLPETIYKLAKIDNIVALKEASGDMDQMSELVSILPNNFKIYSGDDSMTLPLLSLGSYGVVSVASHLIGKQLQEMISEFAKGNPTKALDMHLQLLPIFKTLFITSNPVPLKYALNCMGIEVGGVREPLIQASSLEQEKILNILQQKGLISME